MQEREDSVFENSSTKRSSITSIVVAAMLFTTFQLAIADEDAGNASTRRPGGSSVTDVSFPTDQKTDSSLLDKFMTERTDTGMLLRRQIRRKQEKLQRAVEKSNVYVEPMNNFGQQPHSQHNEDVLGLPEFPMLGSSQSSQPSFQTPVDAQPMVAPRGPSFSETSNYRFEPHRKQHRRNYRRQEMRIEELAFDPDFDNTDALEFAVDQQRHHSVMQQQTDMTMPTLEPAGYQTDGFPVAQQARQPVQARRSAVRRSPADILINKSAEQRRQSQQRERLVSVLDRPQTVQQRAESIFRQRQERPQLEPQHQSINRSNNRFAERGPVDSNVVKPLKVIEPYTDSKATNEVVQGKQRDIDSRLPRNRAMAFARMPSTQLRIEPAKRPIGSEVAQPAIEFDDSDDPDLLDERTFNSEFDSLTHSQNWVESGNQEADTSSSVSLATIGAALSDSATASPPTHSQTVIAQHASSPAYANINDVFEREFGRSHTTVNPAINQNSGHVRDGSIQQPSVDQSGGLQQPQPPAASGWQDGNRRRLDEIPTPSMTFGGNTTNKSQMPVGSGLTRNTSEVVNFSFSDASGGQGPFPNAVMPSGTSSQTGTWNSGHELPSTMLQPINANLNDNSQQQSQPDAAIGDDSKDQLEQDLELTKNREQKRQDRESESRRRVLVQRAEYRADLRSPMSANPAHMTLSYVDDAGKSVPMTEDRQLYLLNFAGYHYSPLDNATVRNHCQAKTALWASPNYCHRPLYFEDVNLERFGARHPFLQPALSGLHFFGSTIRLPYQMAQTAPSDCRYEAGHGRPGNHYCYQRERLPTDFKALSFQALLTTGLIFALP